MRKLKGVKSTFKINSISKTHQEKNVVYSIKFKQSESIYIGSTTRRAIKRWWDHTSQLRLDIHLNIHLSRAFKKYGEKDMVFEIVEICDKNLLEREQYWIDFYNAYKKGFNKCPKAGSSTGIKRTPEQKVKNRLTGNWKKANKAWKGSNHSEETKEIIRAKRKKQIMKPHSEKRKQEAKERVTKSIEEGSWNLSYGNRKYENIIVEKDGVKTKYKNTSEVAKAINSWHNSISQVLKKNKINFKGYKIYLESNDLVKSRELLENPGEDNQQPSQAGM